MQTLLTLRARLVFVAAFVPVMLSLCVPAEATPMTVKGSKGPARYPDNTLITVYIPPDPGGLGRDKDLATGILEWNDERPLKTHHIMIQVKTGQAPPGEKNSVQVNWDPPAGGTELGEALTRGDTGPNGNTMTGGTMNIDPDKDNVDNNEAKNLGIHEMGHILGLDDSPDTGNGMDPAFDKTKKLRITDQDTLELFSTFAAANGTSSDHVSTQVDFGNGLYTYTYTATWEEGIDLALFQVDTNGADVQNIVAPPGWTVNKPLGADVTFTANGDPGTQQFISFVLTDESSYLGPDHPELDFSFMSSAPPGVSEAFLSGVVETTGPVPVPEPATLLLLGSGLIALGMLRSRSSKARSERVAVR